MEQRYAVATLLTKPSVSAKQILNRITVRFRIFSYSKCGISLENDLFCINLAFEVYLIRAINFV